MFSFFAKKELGFVNQTEQLLQERLKGKKVLIVGGKTRKEN
jgi:hypothetical protein